MGSCLNDYLRYYRKNYSECPHTVYVGSSESQTTLALPSLSELRIGFRGFVGSRVHCGRMRPPSRSSTRKAETVGTAEEKQH
jgi:hypothetical protein